MEENIKTGWLSKNIFYEIMKWSEKVMFYNSLMEMEYQTGAYSKSASEFVSQVLYFIKQNAHILEEDVFEQNEEYDELKKSWNSFSDTYKVFFEEKELSHQYDNDDRPYFLSLYFSRPNKKDELDVLDVFMAGKVLN